MPRRCQSRLAAMREVTMADSLRRRRPITTRQAVIRSVTLPAEAEVGQSRRPCHGVAAVPAYSHGINRSVSPQRAVEDALGGPTVSAFTGQRTAGSVMDCRVADVLPIPVAVGLAHVAALKGGSDLPPLVCRLGLAPVRLGHLLCDVAAAHGVQVSDHVRSRPALPGGLRRTHSRPSFGRRRFAEMRRSEPFYIAGVSRWVLRCGHRTAYIAVPSMGAK